MSKKTKHKRGRYKKRRLKNGTCYCDFCGWSNHFYNAGLLEVHHVIPRRDGGSDDDDNLMLLCPNHHRMADYSHSRLRHKDQRPRTKDELLEYMSKRERYAHRTEEQVHWLKKRRPANKLENKKKSA